MVSGDRGDKWHCTIQRLPSKSEICRSLSNIKDGENMKKEKKSKTLFILYCVLYSLVSCYIVVSIPLIATSTLSGYLVQTYVFDKYVPCDGIEKFYSGSNFEIDFISMRDKYLTCYDKIEGKPTKYILKTPLEMCDNTGYDCEDFAHTTMCLCRLYNMKCRQYAEMSFPQGDKFPLISGHAGVQIYKNGKWEIIA